jgi:hypothetical protein
MNIGTATSARTSSINVITLAEENITEVAHFIASQSGQSPASVESHLGWFLLENPAHRLNHPIGYGLRFDDRLVGCILCCPQVFRCGAATINLMGSSSFYVDQAFRGHGGRLFLQYSRSQGPLFGTSANPDAAALWRATGATPIPHTDGELFGVLRWSPLAEEFAHRRFSNRILTRIASSRMANLAAFFRRLKIEKSDGELLQPLTSAEQVNDLRIECRSEKLTSARDPSYIRWRYFSGRDQTTAAFAFRDGANDKNILVTVNRRQRGHRGQITTLNVLDVYPEVGPSEALKIVAALVGRYRTGADAVVLRNLTPETAKIFRSRGFIHRAFQAPTGWYLDKAKLLPARDWYAVPADGDALI